VVVALAGTAPGWMRLWSWRSLAHGACGINYFRWRPCRWGQEEYWHGVLPHSGRPNRRYRELQRMGRELAQVGDLIDRTRPAAQVAIVLSYVSRWALEGVLAPFGRESLFGNPALDAHEAAQAYHAALLARNVTTDALDPEEDLSAYRLVLAPRLYCVDPRTALNLQRYVRAGGTLVLTPRSGVVDQYNVIGDQPAPGPLREIAGVEVDDYGSLEGPLPLRATTPALSGVVEGAAWADEIQPTTARVVATYAGGWLEGTPAITVNAWGKGRVVYVGTLLRVASLDALVGWLLAETGVAPVLETPEGVRAYERRGDGVRLLFLLNYGETAREVALDGAWTDAFTGASCTRVTIDPIDIRLLKQER